jgi:hypothetical protein
MDEENFESQLNELNANFLNDSENLFGLRNGFQFGETQVDGCITNETRGDLIELLGKLDKQPELQQIVNKQLTRDILYIGSECEKLDEINIKKEFKSIKEKLSDKFISLENVKIPTIENIITKWDEVKPSIIFISCHGDNLGLYLQNDKKKCIHYSNLKFISFFEKRSNYTDCVILSSCESLTLGKAIANAGKKVICINKKVDIGTATKFNELFFEYINNHSLDYSNVYRDAFNQTMEIIQFNGLKDTFSFEFISSNKIG